MTHEFKTFDTTPTVITQGQSNTTTLWMYDNGNVHHIEWDANGTIVTDIQIETLEVTYIRTSAGFTLVIDDEVLSPGMTPFIDEYQHSGDPCPDFTQRTVGNHLHVVFYPPANDGELSQWEFDAGTPGLKLKVKLKRQG